MRDWDAVLALACKEVLRAVGSAVLLDELVSETVPGKTAGMTGLRDYVSQSW